MAIETEISNCHKYNVNSITREIWLHPLVEENDLSQAEVDYRMAVIFEKNLRILDKHNDKPILIHQHSCGGNWDDGMAIYDIIKSCRSYITILAYAHARSMSSIFFQAADRRIMMPHAHFLIHYGWLDYQDRETPAINYAKDAEQTSKYMLSLYAKATYGSKKFKGWNVTKITEFIDRKLKDLTDWKLSAEEAVAYGFADGILGRGKYKTIDRLLK